MTKLEAKNLAFEQEAAFNRFKDIIKSKTVENMLTHYQREISPTKKVRILKLTE